jgi:hypothetical protein
VRHCTVLAWLAFAVSACSAEALRYCELHAPVDPAVQDRMIQIAGVVKGELERSGQRVALVARSGLALERFGQRYSHAGVTLKASPNGPWSVRQLYYACDDRRPRIFDQGMSGFVLGMQDRTEGYLSIVLLPTAAGDAAAALEHSALDDRRALQLLGTTYSANAYAFSTRYQNCNQWLAELLASAWDPQTQGPDPRGQAQRWLMDQGYQPTVMAVGWQPLIWVSNLLQWLHNDDHPGDDLARALFRVSMPESIETFVHGLVPQSERIEVCYTGQQIVVRRGWKPIAQGCTADKGDETIELRQS